MLYLVLLAYTALKEVTLQKIVLPNHLPMPQRSHPVKTALRGTTVSQKTSPQATPSQAIMPAQEGTIVRLELDWTGKRVLLGRSATEHTLAW